MSNIKSDGSPIADGIPGTPEILWSNNALYIKRIVLSVLFICVKKNFIMILNNFVTFLILRIICISNQTCAKFQYAGG